MMYYFAIRMGLEARSRSFETFPKSDMVVDLAVDAEYQGPVFVDQGLSTRVYSRR